ncbi:hypothetical protein HHK36_009233 [Tetracentron sinense]|uniref:Protein kinase domain-containing protein n=1 Tax=Tetracentron sinense TaxID=13715 RepID=A0A834ZF52_TETSI|nr:hypothetical protein HHK36_009233 [Tetracentron sinense]
MESPPVSSNVVVVAFDATKDHSEDELRITVNGIRTRGDILLEGDTLLVLGVLHRVQHPMGYQTKACIDSFVGTNVRTMEDEVSKRVDMYVNMLLPSAEQCEDEGVSIKVKITAGTPVKTVVLQEVIAFQATWVILDRHLRRDLKFYLKQIPCKVALIQDSLTVEVMRPFTTNDTDVSEQKLFYSLCKPVQRLNVEDSVNNDQFIISCGSYSPSISSQESFDTFKRDLTSSSTSKSQEHNLYGYGNTGSSSKQEKSGRYLEGENKSHAGPRIFTNQHKNVFQQRSSEAPVLCAGCGMKTVLYIKESMRFSFSDIQVATSDFSQKNLIGEGGYGHVYKGQLKDGQVIAAKVRKEASTQGFTEFHSEVYVLSFARHKNIVMLLGYCSKENQNILVYEYICNMSLEWHLFSKSATVLEWHKRQAIAIGTAKGLRFLHEECRGGPIIHRDLRPSNILLTHDFIPMLGDFGLAKWKTSDDAMHTRVLGTLGYLAPEYAENGIVTVQTDVYAFGIVLLQLISGHKVVDLKREVQQQSLRQWASPLIERLALHELIDPRIGESYDTYELYHMARTAYLCVRRRPEMRPSMGEEFNYF